MARDAKPYDSTQDSGRGPIDTRKKIMEIKGKTL